MGFSYKGVAAAASDRARRLANDHGETARHLVGQAGGQLQAVARNEQVQEVGFALVEGFLGPRASAAAEKAAAGRLARKPAVKKAAAKKPAAKKPAAKKVAAKKPTAEKVVARKSAATAARLPAAKKGTAVKKAAGPKKAAASEIPTVSNAPSHSARQGRRATPTGLGE